MRLIPEEIQKSFAASLDRLLKEREEIDRKARDAIQSKYFELDVEKEMMLKVPSVKKMHIQGKTSLTKVKMEQRRTSSPRVRLKFLESLATVK